MREAAKDGPCRSDRDEVQPVELNVNELAARIAGSNLAFRELAAALDNTDVWTAARLRPLVERIEILILAAAISSYSVTWCPPRTVRPWFLSTRRRRQSPT